MKKILVLMFLGFCFCQDLLTTREYTVEIATSELTNIENEYRIEIDLDFITGYDLDFYKVEINTISLADNFQSDDVECNLFIQHYYDYSFLNDMITSNWGDNLIWHSSQYYYFGIYDCSQEFDDDTFELSLLITAKFPEDNSTGLNGDINEDGTLNIVDIVQLVQIILDGETTGSIFELLDVIRG